LRLNKNIKLIVNYVLGPLVFLLLVYLIYHQMHRQPNWRASFTEVLRAVRGPQQWKLWLVVVLMPVNWGIEAFKWKLALRPAGGIRFADAFRAIFAGTTLASFTPNRMGEYLGRILFVKEGKRLESISLTIVGSMAQVLITLLVGMAGLLYIRPYLHDLHDQGGNGLRWELWLNVLLGLVFLAWVSLTIIYFRLSLVLGILRKIPGLGKYIGYIKILENFDATILLWILFLSFGRYLVFIVQYGLVFPVFGVFLGIGQLWGGVSVVFLVMAVVPTFTFLTELGLRWEAGIQILQLFSINTVGIFAASFAIWLINLIIPALIGSLLILRIKFFKSK
jgi:hypothetical protein